MSEPNDGSRWNAPQSDREEAIRRLIQQMRSFTPAELEAINKASEQLRSAITTINSLNFAAMPSSRVEEVYQRARAYTTNIAAYATLVGADPRRVAYHVHQQVNQNVYGYEEYLKYMFECYYAGEPIPLIELPNG